MKTGDQVTVGGKAGRVRGELLELRAANDMPDIGSLGELSDQAREILAQEFQRIAIVTYNYGGIPVMFVALEDSSGQWWDLQGQLLSIRAARRRSA